MKQKIFISYSDLDRTKMRSMQRTIKLSEEFVATIIADDRKALLQLSEKVKKGIVECDYFVPILTLNSYNTQWINQEIGYASALGKKMIPIVETQVVERLKGFINKELDLPYSYEANVENHKSDISKFARVGKTLINDLLVGNGITPKGPSLKNLFPGKWKNNFESGIEIKDGKYYVNGEHWFDITEVGIDLERKKIIFTKRGLPSRKDKRVLYNELNIDKMRKNYSGIERFNGKKYLMIFEKQ